MLWRALALRPRKSGFPFNHSLSALNAVPNRFCCAARSSRMRRV